LKYKVNAFFDAFVIRGGFFSWALKKMAAMVYSGQDEEFY